MKSRLSRWVASVTLGLLVLAMASVAQASALSRKPFGNEQVGSCLGIGGEIQCRVDHTRWDRFTNDSLDSLVTIGAAQLVLLDPEEVGTVDLEVQNVMTAEAAAKSLRPEVDHWGGYFINGRDPAQAAWTDGQISVAGPRGQNALPVVLGPGETVELTSSASASHTVGAPPEVVEAELLMGWIFDESVDPVVALQAGDADQDLDFDQLDLVKVQQAGKYLSGQTATWEQGDWNGAPGGWSTNPPAGDGQFDQRDIIAALAAATYMTGPYGAGNSVELAGGRQLDAVEMVAVPEPSTTLLFGLGSLALLLAAARTTGESNA